MTLRLQARYATVIVAMAVTFILILSSILLYQFRSASYELTEVSVETMSRELLVQMKERGANMIRYLAETLVNPVYKYDMQAMYELLQAAQSQKDVLFIYVYDADGKIIHDGSPTVPSFGQLLDDKDSILAVRTKGHLISHSDGRVFTVSYPIWIGESPLGGVKVGLSLKEINGEIAVMRSHMEELGKKHLRHNAYALGITTMVLTALGIIFSVSVAACLIRPIRYLATYADRIGQGDYDAKMPVQRTDEIGDLAASLEQMSRNLHRTTREISYLAYHDGLTGLPNRVLFREYLEQTLALARRHALVMAVMFIDLDDFKRVNDTLGHDAGDRLLKEVAQRIENSTRSEDYVAAVTEEDLPGEQVVARLGGDEFTVLLPSIRHSLDVAIIARRIIDALRAPFRLGSKELIVGASIGITVYPNDGEDAEILLKNADLAMYHAKAQGKNCYQYFTDAMNRSALARLSLEGELRQVLKLDQLMLWYQPLVDFRSGQVVGAEALVRWQHPEKGLVLPAEFIPLAEETGIILSIGDWVIKTACEQAYEWNKVLTEAFHVAVNVSSLQFRGRDMVKSIDTACHDTGLDPALLRIEVTETSLLQTESKAEEALCSIRDRGTQVWMDDFGTGYSSLSHLCRFPMDGVKIDRSFVKDMDADQGDLTLTSAIIAMAHSLGLKVVAEGVETPKQLQLLLERQCDVAQGYVFGKPMPAVELNQILEHSLGAPLWDMHAGKINAIQFSPAPT